MIPLCKVFFKHSLRDFKLRRVKKRHRSAVRLFQILLFSTRLAPVRSPTFILPLWRGRAREEHWSLSRWRKLMVVNSVTLIFRAFRSLLDVVQLLGHLAVGWDNWLCTPPESRARSAGRPLASPMLASPGPTVGNTRLLVSEQSCFLLSDLLGLTIDLSLPYSISETWLMWLWLMKILSQCLVMFLPMLMTL